MQVISRAGRVAPIRQTSNAYLMSWVALAAFGLGYIGVAATRPDLLGAILPLAEPQPEQIIAGRSAGDIADELATLRKWVHDLQHDLAAAKISLQDHAAQNTTIAQRLAATEDRLATSRETRTDAAGRTTIQRPQNRAQAPAAPQPVVAAAPPVLAGEPQQQRFTQLAAATAQTEPAVVNGVKVLNGASAPIATGSVPDTAVPAPASAMKTAVVAPQPPRAGPRAVEIGSSESLEGLRAKWGDLSGRNPELGDLAPRYRLTADGRQAPFTLLAGPFDTPDAATRTCDALRAKGVTCRVAPYTGNAF